MVFQIIGTKMNGCHLHCLLFNDLICAFLHSTHSQVLKIKNWINIFPVFRLLEKLLFFEDHWLFYFVSIPRPGTRTRQKRQENFRWTWKAFISILDEPPFFSHQRALTSSQSNSWMEAKRGSSSWSKKFQSCHFRRGWVSSLHSNKKIAKKLLQ